MSTAAPAGNRSASRCAALWALVTTSSATAANPIARRCWATSSELREALFVTYSVREVTAASVSTAPVVGSWPRNTVPSRSRSKQSCSCASVATSAELRDPFLGIGHALDIGGCSLDEPVQGFFALVEREQCFGVGVEQPGGGLSGSRGVELRRRQDCKGLIELAQIRPGACGDDTQFVGVVTGQLGGVGTAGQFDCPLRSAEAAFTVGDQRQQWRLAAQPAGGAQFGYRLRPVAAVIGGNAAGLASGRDSACPLSGSTGVLQRSRRVLVEQISRRNQMACDEVSGAAVECGEFPTNLRGQLPRFDIRRQRGALSLARRVGLAVGLCSARTVGTRRAWRRGPLTGRSPVTAGAACTTIAGIAGAAARLTALATSVVDH